MPRSYFIFLSIVFLILTLFAPNPTLQIEPEPAAPVKRIKNSNPACQGEKTSISTIEMWLAFKQKKKKKELKDYLKSKCIKVLGHTVQYWRPKGGHPPTNIAIGSGIDPKDARLVIDLAFKYNDKVETLVIQALNPPNYAAIATSAWDEKSQIPVSPEDLQHLRDPALSKEEFHALYISLTGEKNIAPTFY